MNQHVTRLAPSPTGALHLGNARTFLLNYLLARTRGWTIVLRMEDIDGPRVRPGAANEALTDLAWLALEWDTRVPDQSQRLAVYQAVVDQMLASGQAYPCVCSRKDVLKAASAPHADDGFAAYPGTCRDRWRSLGEAEAFAGRRPACRVRVGDAKIAFDDCLAGPQAFSLDRIGGDFVIAKADGSPGYQLAVVIDDAAAGVSDVVRGDDLLDSAARQLFLMDVLGLPDRPRYWHVPLVIGPDGRRLAKRHGDTRLAGYRAAGVTAHRVLGLLGYWLGVLPKRQPTEMAELLERFDLGQLPAGPIVMSADDEDYLRGR